MSLLLRLLLLVAACMFLVGPLASQDVTPDQARQVRGILSRNCFQCHGPDPSHRQAGLRLDQPIADRKTEAGHALVASSDRSAGALWRRLTAQGAGDRMPPPKSGLVLTAAELDLLGRWIDRGAPPLGHWSFEPLRRPPLPSDGASTSLPPLDRFVRKELAIRGLAPQHRADPRTLLRRVSLDLIGLPPSLEDVEEFARDPSSEAYADTVRRLLASPAFGERWASVWLDLARYADSSGYGSDPLRTIWRYRDWVIDALNANMPFDRFTIEQLAGDLLPDPTNDQLLATAFHRNTMTNTEGGTDDEEFRVAAVKDRAHTTAQVWMGLTLGCAECHTHKFDPITHEEYYRFYAFFNQTEDTDRADEAPRIPTPTAKEAAQRRPILEQITDLEDRLRLESTIDPRSAERLEDALRDVERRWRPLTPDRTRGLLGTRYRVHPNGEVEAHGPSPTTEIAHLEAILDLPSARAVRLEILPSEDAASQVGRASGHGNIVLTEVELSVRTKAPAPIRGRYVRISLPGARRMLSLAEVEVWEGRKNLARTSTARQSSTDFEGEAARAIDGNADGRYDRGSITHTKEEASPWWEVDLRRVAGIESLVLWNRTDGQLHRRLDGAWVEVLDAARSVVFRTAIRRAPRVRCQLHPASDVLEVPFTRATADFSQKGFSVRSAIDGVLDDRVGWALAPRAQTSHRAVFEWDLPLGGPGPWTLVVRLHQRYGEHHTLGRFRLSVTDSKGPLDALPADVSQALLRPRDARTPKEVRAIAAFLASIDPARRSLHAQLSELKERLAKMEVATTPILRELPAERRRKTHLMIKGNFLERGPEVTPDVPAFLPPLQEDVPTDRLALARWLTRPDHPLTARVAVNRLWARLFGAGLVETPEDFGSQGQSPTHPDLLDWLATEFRDGGFDLKALLTTLVLSETYCQSSIPTEAGIARDPQNRWLWRGPRHRLDAEVLRDQALELAGLLSRKMHGPSVFPPQPEGLWQAAFNDQRTWPTSVGEDRFRRALYTFLRRTIPYPSMATFDAPSRELCTVRRIPTNTPLQALVTLNDPVWVSASQGLARRILREGGETLDARVAFALRAVLLRPPKALELREIRALYDEALSRYTQHPDLAHAMASEGLGPLPKDLEARSPEAAAWTVVSNVLLNLDAVLVKS